jgi:hypothetical protein
LPLGALLKPLFKYALPWKPQEVRMANPAKPSNQGTSSFVWNAIKSDAKRFGVGSAAQYVAPKLAPATRWIIPACRAFSSRWARWRLGSHPWRRRRVA